MFSPKIRARLPTVLANGMRAYTRYRIGAGGQNVDPHGEVPNHHVRKAMAVAGGQSPDATVQAGAASGVNVATVLPADIAIVPVIAPPSKVSQ